MTSKHKAVEVASRRARVADAIALRQPYRAIAEAEGVSFGTIAGDVEALKKDWAKSYGDAGRVFADSAMALDRWQARLEADLDMLAPEDRPAVVNTLVRINDQRNRLFNLYPRPSDSSNDYPTGPIEVRVNIVEAGNRKFVNEIQDGEWRPVPDTADGEEEQDG